MTIYQQSCAQKLELFEWELTLSAGIFSTNQAYPEAIPDATVTKPLVIREAFYEYVCTVSYWSTSYAATF